MQKAPNGTRPLPWLKPAVFLGSLVPLAVLVLRASTGTLGANPIAEALNQLGLLALIFLVASLACTPLKTLFGWTWPIRLRRMLGLFSFFYAVLHVGTYAGLDQFLDVRAVLLDLGKRRFIFVGFAAFALLVPLAVTSTGAAVRRLGYARWKRLHRLAYGAAILAVIHFIWRVKSDVREPTTYAVVLGGLFLVRVIARVREHTAGSEARWWRSAETPAPRAAKSALAGGAAILAGACAHSLSVRAAIPAPQALGTPSPCSSSPTCPSLSRPHRAR